MQTLLHHLALPPALLQRSLPQLAAAVLVPWLQCPALQTAGHMGLGTQGEAAAAAALPLLRPDVVLQLVATMAAAEQASGGPWTC